MSGNCLIHLPKQLGIFAKWREVEEFRITLRGRPHNPSKQCQLQQPAVSRNASTRQPISSSEAWLLLLASGVWFVWHSTSSVCTSRGRNKSCFSTSVINHYRNSGTRITRYEDTLFESTATKAPCCSPNYKGAYFTNKLLGAPLVLGWLVPTCLP